MDSYQESRRGQVPAFGSWECAENGLPFTQCFESARQAGLVRYGRYPPPSQERDLYVAGDLYQNDVVTPAVIVVPRRRTKGGHAHAKKQRHHQHQEWIYNDDSSHDIIKGGLHYPPSPAPAPRRAAFKAVDEDLYKIPSDLLRPRPKRKGGFGFFSSCLMPVCV
ncbi:hypothetical protein V2J09_004942 [Rumex salicifolius]